MDWTIQWRLQFPYVLLAQYEHHTAADPHLQHICEHRWNLFFSLWELFKIPKKNLRNFRSINNPFFLKIFQPNCPILNFFWGTKFLSFHTFSTSTLVVNENNINVALNVAKTVGAMKHQLATRAGKEWSIIDVY